MKFNKLNVLLLTIGLLCLPLGLEAQTSTNSPSFWTQLWGDLTYNTGSNGIAGETNWVAIPYASVDIQQKRTGFGVAALHYVAPNFWAGLRYEDFDGEKDTAGVQCQLQVTKQLWGITYTPFIETSVGIGGSSLYGNAGPGIVVNLWQKSWQTSKGPWSVGIAAVADYEHYVLTSGKNGNKFDFGPALNVSFP